VARTRWRPSLTSAARAGFWIKRSGWKNQIVVSTCVAIAQFWPSWSATAVVPIIFLVGQTLADNVLSPYLVGRRVNLLPVWMIFALFAFGYVFGFVGLLLVVRSPPRAACSCVSR
jgi:predicted PurR-regulated permease PerM